MENKKVITIILDIKNKKVAYEINEVASTLGGLNITHKQLSLQSSGSCDILFMEIGNDPKVELQLAKSLNIPIFIIGAGSDVIANDEGFKGFIIKNKLCGIRIEDSLIVKEKPIVMHKFTKNLVQI